MSDRDPNAASETRTAPKAPRRCIDPDCRRPLPSDWDSKWCVWCGGWAPDLCCPFCEHPHRAGEKCGIGKCQCLGPDAAPPAARTAPTHSDTCIGRVHDSLGCSCGAEVVAPPAARTATPGDGADDETPTLDSVIADMEHALYRQASHYEYRSAIAAFLPRLKAAARSPRTDSRGREALTFACGVAEKCALDHGHEDEATDCGHESFEACVANLWGILRRALASSSPCIGCGWKAGHDRRCPVGGDDRAPSDSGEERLRERETGFREGLRHAAARIPFIYDGSVESYENVALIQKGILALDARRALAATPAQDGKGPSQSSGSDGQEKET